jgi:GNAT superfamily N-acetyltransferase
VAAIYVASSSDRFSGFFPRRELTSELRDTIAVRPTQWRCGIGRSLMSVAVGQLGADGYDAAVLWTINGLVATEARSTDQWDGERRE